MANFGTLAKEWDEESKSCEVYSSVLIKVIVDTMGYDENPQYYVKKIQKIPIKETWKYPSFYSDSSLDKREVDFNHFVTVQYVNVAASKENAQGLIDLNLDFSRDMFYPLWMREDSCALKGMAAAGALALL